jgi:transcription initiation factor TFIIIB Brf1 subunit/transcription initiation factor TFIIB
MAGSATAGPNGGYNAVLGVEVRWCPGCGADRTVEMVRLASDPEPVAVCTECGCGLEAWLTTELVEQRSGRHARDHRDWHGQRGHGAA